MASSIPVAVSNLLTLLDPTKGGAMPEGTQVIFRKYLPVYIAPVTLQISEVHGEQSPAEMSPGYRREEVYDIHCCLACTQGDDDYLTCFENVFTNWAIVTSTIANNWTLAVPAPTGGQQPQGPVRFAQPVAIDFVPDADDKGFVVGELTFTIHCEARIQSLT